MDVTNPNFWYALMGLSVVLIVVIWKKNQALLNNTYVAVSISLLFAIAYFHLVNHYLMDSQGLDYWYLFRK
ncbi:hypothetical protein MYX04_01470 [Nitrospiraceae bacterium AH_259_D15_M11_P09]|nr:hypothetical protein [Nitrospiraceae bacterium AH_259_D15_M11_P09]